MGKKSNPAQGSEIPAAKPAGGAVPRSETNPGGPAGPTGFFHDPGVFDRLREVAFPALTSGREPGRPLRVWVAGCRSGEEVYSVAIALTEYLEHAQVDLEFRIFGTDAHEAAIRKARAGVYRVAALAGISQERARRFFSHCKGGRQIERRIRDRCIFSRHDIVKDAPPVRMDLIVCRNLLSELAEPQRRRVWLKLGYALEPTGYLVVGALECTEGAAEMYEARDAGHNICARKPGWAPSWLDIAGEPEELRQCAAAAQAGTGTRGAARGQEPYPQAAMEEPGAGECARAELRMVNEELEAARQEVASRNAELAGLAGDLGALLHAADAALVLMDRDARIRRFTPKAGRLLELAAGDLGQPITDRRLPFDVPGLETILKDVLESHATEERQVRNARGRGYLIRIRPYLAADRSVEGIILEMAPSGEPNGGAGIRERDYAKTIIESTRLPIVLLDRNFLVRDANQAFYRTFGLPPGDVLGRSLFRPTQANLEIPGAPEVLARLRGGEEYIDEVEIERGDAGGRRYLVLSGRQLRVEDRPTRFLLTFRDITDQKQAAEARYRRLFETARDGIAILDESARLMDVNAALEQLSGYGREEIVGRTPWEIAPGRLSDETRSALALIRERGVLRVPEMILRTRDGRHVPIEVLAVAYAERNRTVIQLNIRDIAERKKLEADLLHRQKLESLGRLAGGIAHDFNNLLTGILGNASLVYGRIPIDSPLRPQLREVMRAAERAAFLTRQLLAYAGKGRFVVERLEIGSLIREISALIRTSIPKAVEIGFDIAAGLPPIEADPGQMQQLIMNLVINGAEAIGENRPGRMELRAAARRISEEEARASFPGERMAAGEYVEIAVTDDGVGMDEETKSRIFDPFFTTKFTGRGLGLAAVMGIVKGHHGGIRVASAPGQGATFEILLPAVGGPAASEEPELPVRGVPTGATVLIIDDEEIVRSIAGAVLERVGFQVLTADNGRAGVETFRRRHGEISCVLLDLLMPEMGGEEALDQLRAIDSGVPVVLSSGFDEGEAARRFAGRTLAGFIQKPYDIERLVHSICAALPGKSGD